VLDAAGIPADIDNHGGDAVLIVDLEDLTRALRELDDYRREDLAETPVRSLPSPDPLPGGWIGILAYAAAIIIVAYLAGNHAFGADWFDAGRSLAGLVIDGEWWRAVTALTLHVDARHLIGNLVFGSVLGLLVSQGLGGGMAWFAILVGGVVGNGANAFLQDARHAAVGASTAVFAALGLLMALAIYQRRGLPGGTLRRWSPLIAGILLLAWTGIGGERTDILAHVMGLLAGLIIGAMVGIVPRKVLESRPVQLCMSGLAILIMVLSWSLALS
jgi:membrane associated rhomboid family serine protease